VETAGSTDLRIGKFFLDTEIASAETGDP